MKSSCRLELVGMDTTDQTTEQITDQLNDLSVAEGNGCRLFVRNLSFQTTWQVLKGFFVFFLQLMID